MSVNTEEEARSLLTLACPRNGNGDFVARELIEEQTLENLEKFGSKLEEYYALMMKNRKDKK